jgi:transcriptional regulator with XRE-family HTH domain
MYLMTPVNFDHRTSAELTSTVARNIRAALDRREMSGRELCRRLGVSHNWLSKRLTDDQSMTLADLGAVAEELGTSPGELLGMEEQRLARPELEDLNEALKHPRLPRAALDIVLGLVGQAVAVAILATPRTRALPPAPKEPQMTTRKVTRRAR